MASISPRRNKDGSTTWRVRYRLNGRAKQASFRDRGEALRFKELAETPRPKRPHFRIVEDDDRG